MQIKLELFYGMCVFIVEAGWIIYGNTFIYTAELAECRKEKPDEKRLWMLSLVLIIQGYIVMLIVLGVILFASGAYFMYKSWSAEEGDEGEEEANSRMD